MEQSVYSPRKASLQSLISNKGDWKEMDNNTATACTKCHAIIFYDKDAPKPDLCPVCKREKKEEEEKK